MTKPAKKPEKKPVKKITKTTKAEVLAKESPGEAFEAFHKAKAPTPESHPELFDTFGNRL